MISPPVIRTLPLFKTVAVWACRHTFRLPVRTKLGALTVTAADRLRLPTLA